MIVLDKGVIVKNFVKNDVDSGTTKCRSYNDNKDMYPDREIDLREVFELYNVVKVEKSR